MRTIHRNQAEIEAKETSLNERSSVTVYKLQDGRYEVKRGYEKSRAGSAIARFINGRQDF